MSRPPRAAAPTFGADDFRAALAMFATGVLLRQREIAAVDQGRVDQEGRKTRDANALFA